jgi:predicted hotdog family 3-hydroxylacyl-ACP dehydratase
VTGGALPAGLTLNASTGAITGTPTAAGAFAFSVRAADASDATDSATANYNITIAASPVAITATSLPAGRVNVAYSAAEQATGGSGSYKWSIVSGALPAGLTLSGSNGTISGTPTVSGTFTVTIAAADAMDASNVATAAYSLMVSTGVKITSPRTIPNATHDVFYSYQMQASDVVGTPKWSLAGGSIPPGITLNATTGVISGTCTTTGMWHFNVRVTDASSSGTQTVILVVK